MVLASSIHINTSFRKRRLAQQQPAAAAVAGSAIAVVEPSIGNITYGVSCVVLAIAGP